MVNMDEESRTTAVDRLPITHPLGLRRAYLAMHRAGDALFAAYGVTADQFAMLRITSHFPGLTQRELADKLYSDPNTVAAMVALLEKRNLIRREVHAEDGRARRAYLTKAAEKRLAKMLEGSEPLHRRVAECFEGTRGECALEVLAKVQEVMTAYWMSLLGRKAAGRKPRRNKASSGPSRGRRRRNVSSVSRAASLW